MATRTDGARLPERVRVELLYFDGCPTHEKAEQNLRKVLAEEGMNADVSLVAVNPDGEARRLHFPGSPTIRVNDGNLFPVPDRRTWGFAGCT